MLGWPKHCMDPCLYLNRGQRCSRLALEGAPFCEKHQEADSGDLPLPQSWRRLLWRVTAVGLLLAFLLQLYLVVRSLLGEAF